MSQNRRCLGAALIVCGVLSFAGTVAIHWGGFAAYVESIMRADPRAGQVAIADLFGIEPKTWQLVDTWSRLRNWCAIPLSARPRHLTWQRPR